MSPAAQLLAAYLDYRLVGLALFFGWWAIWFTLGRNFGRTSLLCVLAKGVSLLAAWGVFASGAFGVTLASSQAEISHPSASALMVSGVLFALVFLGLELLVLRRVMRKDRPKWGWNTYDLRVMATVHAIHVASAVWLV
ncbi:MAG: hypothetical protein HOM34_04085 [Planctomycetes bacterium]|jgi:hypothetical protein|nr:hypothetical protein [Planctomycetota bacterium]MBT4029479.1 hypothetical protein [Planctomycetota bacterium]MBT4560651.1 hypothetical protein [Planctomycetota bacterium]MBT5101452.1 hypothetical protein [Planctomycetota bacterium]MBT5119880.1 hypothetical protein [Planctomycetota bacterium]